MNDSNSGSIPYFKPIYACTLLLLLLATFASKAADPAPFVLQLSTPDPKTIGDMKPAFVVYKDKALPKVSIEYIMKRYNKLFKNSKSPDVKIDALNRINNLSATYGLTSKKLTIDKVKQSKAVLNSYDAIVDSGVFYERMDELLYQTGKASLFVGNKEESIKRLKLLVGLYPRSQLADESMFRMAEAYFDLGDYSKAEAQYKKVLAFSKDDEFHQRSKFKLGWAEFRLDRFDDAGEDALEVLDYHPSIAGKTIFSDLDESAQDLVEDTLRLLSILFSKQEGADSIEALQQQTGQINYSYLMYDALFRFYLKQDRFEESAVVAAQYASRYAARFDAYLMALNSVKAYQSGDFEIRTWNSKEEFVANFGLTSHYWAQLDTDMKVDIRPYLTEYLAELAHLYYVRMQENRDKNTDAHMKHGQRAKHYYMELVQTEPSNSQNGEYVFLAAEALRDIGHYSEAIELYVEAAYQHPAHQYALAAGYASVLTFDDLVRIHGGLSPEETLARRDRIKKYALTFNNDERTPDLLNELANELYDEGDFVGAQHIAAQVLSFDEVKPTVRYSSQLVNAHSHFELSRFAEAEAAYQVASNNPLATKSRLELRERLAASIYKQAESQQDLLASANMYLKVVDSVPEASIVPQALFDASVQQITASAWSAAIATLSHFQESFPKHDYNHAVTEKLIYAYTENQDWVPAADKLIELAAMTQDKNQSGQAYFQAAEFYQKSGFDYESISLYGDFISRYPMDFSLNIEAFDRIIDYYESQEKGGTKSLLWSQGLVDYENARDSERTARSAELAAKASYNLALPHVAAFKHSKLILPLKKSLKVKNMLLKKATKELELVASYHIASWQAAATHEIGSLYRTLAKDLLSSERPDSLNTLQLEQYDILLEEQAYPFEEQAMDIFALNTARAALGHFDEWVKLSFEVLAQMNPSEYQRNIKTSAHAADIF